jgi:hypothetical protein
LATQQIPPIGPPRKRIKQNWEERERESTSLWTVSPRPSFTQPSLPWPRLRIVRLHLRPPPIRNLFCCCTHQFVMSLREISIRWCKRDKLDR